MAILGTETEYGVWAAGLPDGVRVEQGALSEAVIGHVDGPSVSWDLADEHPLTDALRGHLPSDLVDQEEVTNRPGITNRMLANGGRSYVDHAHPEMSTPEVTSARAVVAHEEAGDRIHLAAAHRAGESLGLDLRLARNTTDNQGHSYGHHENFLVSRDVPFERIVEQFAGFLASRVVVGGAGRVGLGQDGSGPGFQTSQRADFMERLVGLQTTRRRGLVNTRDEPHADARLFRRLHVIAGDATRSQVQTMVAVGSAQLVLAAIEQGADVPGPIDAVAAMHTFSRDVGCRAVVVCTDGVERSAVQLQQAWLESSRVARPDHPLGDAARVMEEWARILDDLAVDPARCADRLDWVAKLALLTRYRERDGLSWQDPRLSALDLAWADLEEGRSPFSRLVSKGLMRTLLDEQEVATAMVSPPSDTRARRRAELVAQHGADVLSASWDRVVVRLADGSTSAHLLKDPFGND